VTGVSRSAKKSGSWLYDWLFRRLEAQVPLGVKLVVPVVISTVMLVNVLGTIVSTEVRGQVEKAYERQAEATAAGVEVMFMMHPDDEAMLNTLLKNLKASRPEIVAIRIYSLDADGIVVASSNPDEVGKSGFLDRDDQQAIWDGRAYEDEKDGPVLTTIEPLRAGGYHFGAVVITTTKTAVDEAVRSIEFRIFEAGAIAIVVETCLVLWTLYMAIIRRTRRVQRAVGAMHRGDVPVRLPEGHEAPARDEIIALAQSVDKMIVTLDERQRGDELIRRLAQKALQGMPPADLIGEGLAATREALGLEECIFASINEDGSMATWRDGSGGERSGNALPIWLFALTSVAVEARKAVLTNRLGRQSRFMEAPQISTPAHAAIVPLPRTSKAGQAIIAIAPAGEAIPEGALAVIDAVAATIAESLHMKAAETARAESAVKSKVMAAVSHEMRNPLNSILGFTGLLLGASTPTLTDKQRRQLTYVQASANNMLGLVNNYLDLAKVRSGSLSLQYETVRLAAVVADVVALMQPMSDNKKVTVRASVAPDTVARVDPTRVRHILTNLLSNAVKFTPPGGRVYIRARSNERGCRIVVSDSGVGIPRDQQKLLFLEFAKIDAGAMAAAKGTGLGLALTKAFVSAMGGTIKVYSRHGRGSTFVVVLPREQDKGAEAPAA
jgi:signal transduction histidine kinase